MGLGIRPAASAGVGPPASTHQTAVQRGEELVESLGRHVRLLVGVTEPLQRRDADGAVKGSGAERQALAEVVEQDVPLHLPLPSHVCRDIQSVSSGKTQSLQTAPPPRSRCQDILG